jgi:hypothetical protein
MRSHSGRWFIVALFITFTVVACSPSPGTPPPVEPPDDAEIVITSDRTFILTEVGDQAQIEAVVVLADGTEEPRAAISYSSSAPDVITVNDRGQVTAVAPLGSAMITLSAGNLEAINVSVVVAELTPETVMIDSSLVQSVDLDTNEVILSRTSTTEALQMGDVMISGDLGGVLARVQSVSPATDRVIVQTEPASLTDAFINLEVEAEGIEVEIDAIYDEDDLTILDSRGKLILQQTLPGGLKCEGAGGVSVNVSVTGASIQQRIRLRLRADARIRNRTVERFDLYFEGGSRVTATLGEISVTGGGSRSFTCSRELPPIRLGAVPVVGPVIFGPTANPKIGFTASVSFTGASLKLNGPKLDRGFEAELGVGYTATDGFRAINNYSQVGSGVEFGNWSSNLDQAFVATIEPFLGVELGAAVLIVPFELVSARFVNAKAYGGLSLNMTLPINPRDEAYRGPRWNLFAGVSADLGPLLKEINAVKRIFEAIGIANADDVVKLNVKLFDFREILDESPDPTVTVSPAAVEVDSEVTLSVRARGAGANPVEGGQSRVEFVAFNQDGGDAIDLATTQTAANEGSATWAPGEDDEGTYKVTALVYSGALGAFGIPYGAAQKADLVVTSEPTVVISPASVRIAPDEVQTFTASVVGIDDQSVTWFAFPAGGTLTLVDDTTVTFSASAPGDFTLTATSNADASIFGTATIAVVEEREQELDICEVWSVSNAGGVGTTVDNWDISEIPAGAVFDIRFDAFSIPDKFIVSYAGTEYLDTGWRGSSSYEGDPRYPGGIAGPGQGEVLDIFSKASTDTFEVTVIGVQSGTAWNYQVRCRVLEASD